MRRLGRIPSLRSFAILYRGRVIEHYGGEYVDYLDLLSIASDYGIIITIHNNTSAIIKSVFDFGIILVVERDALGLGLLEVEDFIPPLPPSGEELYEVVVV